MERAASRGGDRAWFPQGAKPVIALRIVTWNASALVHATLSKRKGKRAKLIELIRDLDVCMIQETHAGFEDVIVAFPELLRLFHVLASEGENRASGGVVTLVSKKWCDPSMNTSHEQIVQGRVSRVLISDGRRNIVFWNIHNFAILDCMLA
eukprot:14934261-Heterocapsa_arctica.AAC.1